MRFTDIDSLDLRHISLASYVDEVTSIPLSEMEELKLDELMLRPCVKVHSQGV